MASTISTPSQDSTGQPSVTPEIDYDDADIVLVSSKAIHFHVHKSILSLASPVFEAVLSIPQPESDDPQRSSEPIVLLEDQQTIQTLINLVYPDRHCSADTDLSILLKTAAAARKYEMAQVHLRYSAPSFG